MSDSLRVRLEFKRWSNPELRNSLLSFKRNETKKIQNLRQLIEKRFHLQQNFLLLIDGFVLESEESIDVVRDNDLIVIEPKPELSLTKVKTEPKVKTEDKSSFNLITHSSYFSDKPIKSEVLPKIELKFENEEKKKKSVHNIPNKPRIGPKSKMKEWKQKESKSKQYVSSDSSSCEELPKSFETPVKNENKGKSILQNKQKSVRTPINTSEKDSKPIKSEIKPEIKLEVKEENKDLIEIELTSNRDIPLRKAFKKASTSLKEKPLNPQKLSQTIVKNETNETPKPKKKRTTKEATEPMDRFSPIIICERQLIPKRDDSEQHIQNEDIKSGMAQNIKSRTQSARKSFPNPPRNTNIKKIEENVPQNEKKLSQKQIDFDFCEPMTSIPDVGDIIAFKMLTLSADGNGYESSYFKMGSVLNVNKENQMIDILLQDVIKRDNFKTSNKSEEQLFGIHSLKINWTTVLEPKLVQRKTEPELMIL